MFAAIYCRKSVNTMQGESIQSQLEHCRAYLAAHRSAEEAQNALVYRDEGFSGAALARPAMQQLLADIRAGHIHCVVCYRLDRISRNVADFTALMEEFARCHVSFLCAAEAFDTEKPMGRAMLYIASVFAQLERETIAERVRDNMYTLAADGRWLGGKPPFGYRLCRTTPPYSRTVLVPDAIQFPQLCEIFRAVLQSGELSAGMLYGVTLRNLRQILRNPVYIAADCTTADLLTQDGYTVLFLPQTSCDTAVMPYGKRPNHAHSHACRMAASGEHPAVCSGADWAKLRQLLHPQPIRSISRAPVGMLSRLLRCGICGDVMECKRRSGREGQFDYICRTKNREKRCDCPNCAGIAADAAVWEQCMHHAALPASQTMPMQLRQSVVRLLTESATWNGTVLQLTLRQ